MLALLLLLLLLLLVQFLFSFAERQVCKLMHSYGHSWMCEEISMANGPQEISFFFFFSFHFFFFSFFFLFFFFFFSRDLFAAWISSSLVTL